MMKRISILQVDTKNKKEILSLCYIYFKHKQYKMK